MAEDIQALIAEVNRKYESLKDATYYELLEVPTDASADEVRARFRELAKHYHADRYAGQSLPPEVTTRMTQVLSQISRAYSTLTNPEKRKEYDATLAMRAAGVPTDLETIVEAENLYRSGCTLMDQGKYHAALERLEEACRMNPAESEFAATAAYCKYWTLETDPNGRPKDRRTVKAIINHLTEFLGEHRQNDQVAVQLGLLAKSEGDMDHAVNYFRQALSINKRNVVAARELRLHEMRRRRNSGFFARIFGRGKDK